MKKIFLVCVLGLFSLSPCFAQNMLILGGEYNPFKPGFWNSHIGFNIELFNENIQNDFLLCFGGITAKNEAGEEPHRFLFCFKDKLFFSLDGDIAGFRAGITAGFGVYESPPFPKVSQLFFNAGGVIGAALFPKSLISVTIDACPGYAIAFRATDVPDAALDEAGFMLALSIGFRLNLDKL